MKGMNTYRRGLAMVLAAVMAIVALGPVSGASAGSVDGKGSPTSPIPVVGGTFGALSNAWWQWAYSIPVDQNPLLDESGANCGIGQSGPVFNLAGIFNETGTANRPECVVPAGKALFVPILNAECSNVEGNGMTEKALRDCAKGLMDMVDPASLQLDVDGYSFGHLENFRVSNLTKPQGYHFTLPDNNVLQLFGYDAPAGDCYYPDPTGRCVPYLSVSDGYYMLLPPLRPGQHTIHFHGSIPDMFTLDVTYDPLTVR